MVTSSVNRRQCVQLILLSCLALGAAGCTGFDVLNSMVPSCGYARTSNISYGSLPRQKLDVYRPRNAPPNARVVIFFYGGVWKSGQKENYRFAGEAFTTQGFVAVLPDYRLYPEVTFPAFVQDGALAVRWVHDHIADFGGDPSRIYLMGHSAGAHIAALLTLDGHYLSDVGLDRSSIRATVGMAGPYWFEPFPQDRGIFNMKPTDTKVDPAIEPLNFADGHAPPMLLMQGMRDTLVDPQNAFALATLINHNGGHAKVIWYNDRGHKGVLIALASEFRWLAPVLRDASDFIRAH
jgi:acetyl esterase/lipase